MTGTEVSYSIGAPGVSSTNFEVGSESIGMLKLLVVEELTQERRRKFIAIMAIAIISL